MSDARTPLADFFSILLDRADVCARPVRPANRVLSLGLDPAGADLYYVRHQRLKGCDCDLSLVADKTEIDDSVRGSRISTLLILGEGSSQTYFKYDYAPAAS